MQNSATALTDNLAPQQVNRISADNQDELLSTAGERSSRPSRLRDYRPGQKDKPRAKIIKKILVPTDFSPSSARAVERAVAVANQCDATLTILHVLDINVQAVPGEAGTARELMERLWGEGATRMGQLAWSLCGRVEAQTRLEEGLPWEEIVEASRDFDLVILGKSRARTGWNLFSKRTAQRVVENTACPVMVVPDKD